MSHVARQGEAPPSLLSPRLFCLPFERKGFCKTRKSTQDARARFSRTPTNARIQTSETMRVLDGQRSLAHPAHALHGGTADQCLHQGGRFAVHQDGVEPVKFVYATLETRDARRDPYKRSRWRWCCLRLALCGGDDAALAFLAVLDPNKV